MGGAYHENMKQRRKVAKLIAVVRNPWKDLNNESSLFCCTMYMKLCLAGQQKRNVGIQRI